MSDTPVFSSCMTMFPYFIVFYKLFSTYVTGFSILKFIFIYIRHCFDFCFNYCDSIVFLLQFI